MHLKIVAYEKSRHRIFRKKASHEQDPCEHPTCVVLCHVKAATHVR